MVKFNPNLYTALLFFVILVPLTIYIYTNAVRLAKNNKNYALKTYNKWQIYVSIIIVYGLFSVVHPGILFPDKYSTSSEFMEKTILTDEKFLANDMAYGLKIPLTDYFLTRYKKPAAGDVIYFDYYDYDDNNEQIIKIVLFYRIIGTPGDEISIINKNVFINRIKFNEPHGVQFIKNSIKTKGIANNNIYPAGSMWNEDNYGPINVPMQGEIISLNINNILTWKKIIQFENNKIHITGSKIYINGIETVNYKIKDNYYFVMGDNRDIAIDSRFLGFIPETNIIGKITMIYWSWNTNIPLIDYFKLLGSIRWDRIGTKID